MATSSSSTTTTLTRNASPLRRRSLSNLLLNRDTQPVADNRSCSGIREETVSFEQIRVKEGFADRMGKRQQQQQHQSGNFGGMSLLKTAPFMKWGLDDAIWVLRHHPLPSALVFSLVFFMGVEYTLCMVPASSPPFDLGFQVTRWLNHLLFSQPFLNTLFAGLNTVFVAMQTTYILWTILFEGRIRPGLAALFMFTCRGILGYSTQLPLPQEFLGSGADFPVGNVSFFLFFSGHVGGAVIASLDMRRTQRKGMAWLFDILNFCQVMRLLGTRGHYTIDLAVGVGAGILFDHLAGKYEDCKRNSLIMPPPSTAKSVNNTTAAAAAANNNSTALSID